MGRSEKNTVLDQDLSGFGIDQRFAAAPRNEAVVAVRCVVSSGVSWGADIWDVATGGMNVNIAPEKAVHGLSTRVDLPTLVRSLQDVLGQQLVAVIAQVSDSKAVGKWAKGERSPHPETERRLRDAFYVVQLLLQYESTAVARAWFLGMNPDLDDRSPALVLAERPQDVLKAARSFIANG